MKITTYSQRQVPRETPRHSLLGLRAGTPPRQERVFPAVERQRVMARNDIPVTTHLRKTRYRLAAQQSDLQEGDAGSKLPVGAWQAAENEGWRAPTPQSEVPRYHGALLNAALRTQNNTHETLDIRSAQAYK
jgi:hypothetical protein